MYPRRHQRPLIVPTLLVVNAIVFALWYFEPNKANLDSFMAQNFLVSFTALQEGRFWVLLTSVFSHNLFIHFLINMFVLNSFGTLMEVVLGRRFFLHFYLVAGVVSSLAHGAVSAFVMDKPELPALGASGAIAGVILTFALVFPKEKILLFGLIPLPAIVGALGFIGLDLWGLLAQAQGGGLPIGHGAHLGGAFTGVFYYFLVIKPRMRRRMA